MESSCIAVVAVILLLANANIKALPTFDIGNIQTVKQLSKSWAQNLHQFNISLKEEFELRPIWEDVSFWCFNRKSNKFRLTLGDYADFRELLQRNRSTVLFVHGWLQNKQQFADGAKRLALAVANRNYCVVDFEPLATVELQLFINAVSLRIATYLAGFVQSLGTIDIPPEQVTLVGEGVSAHLVGQAGQLLGGHLGSIVGLDPLGPFYTVGPIVQCRRFTLDPTDAQFVQVWYSSIGQLGSSAPLGHQNIYVNGGIHPQPCCSCFTKVFGTSNLLTQLCSHYFAVEVFKATLDPSIDLLATKCPSYKHFLAGRCQIRPTTRVTDQEGTEAGNFYLETSCKPPYL
ncbi:phospholipase A1 member A-like [Anopheles maculipalpis]|uniref:phospholipase A1 member A-like n=1 Tax=Anopheles maculipalpis TaxID=1496333 RepID=UPI0021594AC4|nr:phospholipase A1 member A-like [Anopheles maculipalpis]